MKILNQINELKIGTVLKIGTHEHELSFVKSFETRSFKDDTVNLRILYKNESVMIKNIKNISSELLIQTVDILKKQVLQNVEMDFYDFNRKNIGNY